MSRLFWLSDDQWAAIEPFMPTNQPGARRVDDRRVISGIIHVLKTGCRWIDCPKEYGPHTTVYNRYNRWSRKRFWTRMLEAFANAGASRRRASIDSTFVKAQRAALGGKGGRKRRTSALARRKDYRRVATRYDKLSRNFLAAVALATLVAFWIRLSLGPRTLMILRMV